jgi:hypothetical protein
MTWEKLQVFAPTRVLVHTVCVIPPLPGMCTHQTLLRCGVSTLKPAVPDHAGLGITPELGECLLSRQRLDACIRPKFVWDASNTQAGCDPSCKHAQVLVWLPQAGRCDRALLLVTM